MTIPFNKPFIAGKELHYIAEAVTRGNISGDGYFTQACASLMQERFDVARILMTPSCTAALEMAAQLCDLQAGDEVIMPSYTFVSTASAFVRMGAKPVFVDIRPDTMNLDETLIEEAITDRTRAICVVHYAGVSCEMDRIMAIARGNDLRVIEDAAQGVNAFWGNRALGSIGDVGCYSFHETKNFICGEGGALCINDPELISRAEIIRDKGTNRQQLFRGEVDKYTWVDVGSSYVPSEISSAFLFGQLEEMERISQRREEIYEIYHVGLRDAAERGELVLPTIPEGCISNHHMFYVLVRDNETRNRILGIMSEAGVRAVFHYVPLHSSPVGVQFRQGSTMKQTDSCSERLIRLPFYYSISSSEQERVIATLCEALSESRVEVSETGHLLGPS